MRTPRTVEKRACIVCGAVYTARRNHRGDTCPDCLWSATTTTPRTVTLDDHPGDLINLSVRVTVLSPPIRWSGDMESDRPYTPGAVHTGTIDDVYPLDDTPAMLVIKSDGSEIEFSRGQHLMIEVL